MSKWRFAGISDQRKAALRRATDARRLREHGRWRGAMYLRGYEVECTLKARLMEKFGCQTLTALEQLLARRFRRKQVDLRTHNLEYLFDLTGARPRLRTSATNQAVLRAYQHVNRWTVDWRYNPDASSEDQCQTFFDPADRFPQFVRTSV